MILPTQVEYCFSKDDPAPHLAARFVGKEAVIKVLSNLDISCIFYPDIENLSNELGVPYVRINTKYNKNLIIKISLLHNSVRALALCIIIQEG